MSALLNYSDTDLLRAAQTIYDIPSLAAWRAAELKALRHCDFVPPVLEIGCGSGLFTALLLPQVECGIDRNPREVALCSARTHLYGRVACMDARALEFPDGAFATVFANCVIEHISDLAQVLAECRRVLRPSGTLVATVPLREMNRHLLLRGGWYARLRAAQLQHLNLLSEPEWVAALSQAGFDSVQTTPYLSAQLCRQWDGVDGLLSIGAGPATLGRAYRLGLRLLPRACRSIVNRQWQQYFTGVLQQNPLQTPCAVVIQASAPAWAPQPAT